jgi:phosphate transport system permease protein
MAATLTLVRSGNRSARIDWTRLSGEVLLALVRGLTVLVMLFLCWILWRIFWLGKDAVTWEFLTDVPRNGMEEGGIFPAIFGTVSIVILMILFALPLGVLSAVYLVEYAGKGVSARVIRAAVNNLAGVPSIVFGLFGVGFFILFVGHGVDRAIGQPAATPLFGQPAMLWAALTLAILVLPVVIVSTQEALLAVPASHRSASFAIGATKWQTVRNVVLPQARAGILTGAILSISRGAGETAPILFTGCAYFLPRLPLTEIFGVPVINPLDQFMELSYHIFIMATQSTNVTKTLPIQYGTTLVLLGLTFLLNLSAILLRIRFRGGLSKRV